MKTDIGGIKIDLKIMTNLNVLAPPPKKNWKLT
jgi:hypothetical protein